MEDEALSGCFAVLSHYCRVQFFAAPWTEAHQAPLSMGFSQQEHWSRLPCPPPGNLPDPGIKPASPVSPEFQADSLLLSHRGVLQTASYHLIPSCFKQKDNLKHLQTPNYLMCYFL